MSLPPKGEARDRWLTWQEAAASDLALLAISGKTDNPFRNVERKSSKHRPAAAQACRKICFDWSLHRYLEQLRSPLPRPTLISADRTSTLNAASFIESKSASGATKKASDPGTYPAALTRSHASLEAAEADRDQLPGLQRQTGRFGQNRVSQSGSGLAKLPGQGHPTHPFATRQQPGSCSAGGQSGRPLGSWGCRRRCCRKPMDITTLISSRVRRWQLAKKADTFRWSKRWSG